MILLLATACSTPEPARDAAASDGARGDVSVPDADRDAPGLDTGVPVDAASPTACEAPTILDGFAPTRVLHLSPTGDDANDGLSADHAWRSLAHASTLLPGDEVRIAAGTYSCGVYVVGLHGTAAHPIVFRSVDGPHAARFDCAGGGGLQFQSVEYLAFDGLEIANAGSGHAFHVHSGDMPVTFRSNHVLVTHCSFHDAMLSAIKASQSTDLDIIDCDLGWTSPGAAVGGQGIDFVAVDHSRILRNHIHDVLGNVSVQVKGGSTDVLVDGNVISNTDVGINLGQSTGPQFFLPTNATWEAQRAYATNNVVFGHTRVGLNAEGCLDCLMANNTLALIDPGQPLRALTGGVGIDAVGVTESHTSGLRLIGNLVYMTGATPGALLNFTPDNVAGLVQSHNLFFHTGSAIGVLYSDTPVGGPATGTLVDRDPLLASPSTGDVALGAGSPAIAASVPVPEVRTDATGACRTSWNIGAL